MLEAFIALRERNLVAGAEALLLDDFLLYTEDHFPDLGPFRTLRLAHGNWFRQTRRLRQLLGEAVDLDATIDYYGPYIETPAGEAVGAKTYLRMTDDEQVELAMYPADTLSQARAFFTNPAAVAGVARLCEQPGWRVGPNFHFGHMQRGYCWTMTSARSTSTWSCGRTRSTTPATCRARSGTSTGPGLKTSGSPGQRTGPSRPAL